MNLDAIDAEIRSMEPRMHAKILAMKENPPTTRDAAMRAAFPETDAEEPECLGPSLGNLPKEVVFEVVKLLEGEDAANFARVNDTCWDLARPFEAWYFKLLHMIRCRERTWGAMLVRGLVEEPSERRHDVKMVAGARWFYDPLVLATLEQMRDSVRFILLTQNRMDALAEAEDFATGGQAGGRGGFGGFDDDDSDSDDESGGSYGPLMFFNTTSGNDVIFGIPDEVEKALGLVPAAARFDCLLALTCALDEHDSWLSDNESGCGYRDEEGDEEDELDELESALKIFASAWRTLLVCTDAQLGIDAEFTRPGVEALMEKFERKIQNAKEMFYDDDKKLRFNWRGEEEEDDEDDEDVEDDDEEEDDEEEEEPGEPEPEPEPVQGHGAPLLDRFMTIKSHYELLDEVCERLGADEIFLVRGKHTEDVESTRKVILTPGRKQAIEVAETFVMVGALLCKF